MENSWDYGHIGVLLKNNLKTAWINYFVSKRTNALLYEGNILTSHQMWKASGHLENFEKLLIECKSCNKRFEADKNQIPSHCSCCNSANLTEPKNFNLIFQTDKYYLRPETAQTIFVNTKTISVKSHLSLPLAIAQTGKAFRNEVSPGKTIFRTKEFEQLEFEEFVLPERANETLEAQKNSITHFLTSVLSFSPSSFEFREVDKKELPHYSLRNCDLYYNFEFGKEELWGVANRGDFDLKSHQKHSGEKLHFQVKENSETLIPHIVEHSAGLNRLLLALITEKLCKKEGRAWEILSLPIHLAPFKFAILPLTKTQEESALSLYDWLNNFSLSITYSKKGSIGKRYKEQDSIGTPFCLTIDFESASWNSENFSFTLRERDNGLQTRLTRTQLRKYIFDCWNVPSELR